ncbi:PadR family transcriptional regulator [Candidatus Saccharibacteria bacterium]|nr:MAG: PadR family transcriptional regulator [Candidatus Saccharibacteria bacterium]
MNSNHQLAPAEHYAENLATQLRKGFLTYCVLLICSGAPKYTSDILQRLSAAQLVVVEGTIYPLLNRLQKDGLLEHEWQESDQGPPRKYYRLTPYGEQVAASLQSHVSQLHKTLTSIEKGSKQ